MPSVIDLPMWIIEQTNKCRKSLKINWWVKSQKATAIRDQPTVVGSVNAERLNYCICKHFIITGFVARLYPLKPPTLFNRFVRDPFNLWEIVDDDYLPGAQSGGQYSQNLGTTQDKNNNSDTPVRARKL